MGLNRGDVANLCTIAMMCIGVALRTALKDDDAASTAGAYIMAFGLFGFAGGATNWIAIVMLFDEIPGVFGSGIIPKQFKAIRATMKNMIMDTFFEPTFLTKQLKKKFGPYSTQWGVEDKLRSILSDEEFNTALERKLEKISTRPAGLILKTMGIGGEQLKALVKGFIGKLADDVAPHLSEIVADKAANPPVNAIVREVDRLMEERLEELTPNKVKSMVEDVLRAHLSWLVVWGSVFGGCIGVISEAVGY